MRAEGEHISVLCCWSFRVLTVLCAESSDAHVQDLLDDIDGLLDDSPPPVPEANRSTKTFRIAPYETVHFGSDDA